MTGATIKFSRKELFLFVSVINEMTNGIRLDTNQTERLGKTRESARDLLEQVFHALDAT